MPENDVYLASIGTALVNGQRRRGLAMYRGGDSTMTFLILPVRAPAGRGEPEWMTIDADSYVAEAGPVDETVVRGEGFTQHLYLIDDPGSPPSA